MEVVAKVADAETTLKNSKETGLFVKPDLYSQLPAEVKNLICQARDGAEKGKEISPASTRDVHQAETKTVQAAETVPTAALGIMQAVTTTTLAAPDLRNVLAAVRGLSSSSNRGEYCIADDGKVYLTMNTLRQYQSSHERFYKPMTGSLMDSGANGGMAGNGVKIIAYHDHDCAQVNGIAGNCLEDLPIITAAGFIESTEGPVIGIFQQYAYYGKRKTIHSVSQIEHFD